MKLAISIPKKTAQELDHFRHKLGVGRSSAILQAVLLWLHQMKVEQQEERYVRGYKKKPENDSSVEALYRAGLASFSKEEW